MAEGVLPSRGPLSNLVSVFFCLFGLLLILEMARRNFLCRETRCHLSRGGGCFHSMRLQPLPLIKLSQHSLVGCPRADVVKCCTARISLCEKKGHIEIAADNGYCPAL